MERFLKSKYKIGDKLSENPFSVTYHGLVMSSKKPVIIKIYKRGTLNSSLIKKMKEKVRELVRIEDHKVAKLLDGDYGWQGFYYVREYIKGQSLAEVMKERGRLKLEQALPLTEQICQGLDVVQKKGIVHGALKPNNIIFGPEQKVVLTDFVIEGAIREAIPQKTELLFSDNHYLSPEELDGGVATLRSDIYSLGIIFYELLSGEPFIRSQGLKGAVEKLKKAQVSVAGMPDYIQQILAKALQKDPLRRFGNAADFKRSLEQKGLGRPPRPLEEYIELFEKSVPRYILQEEQERHVSKKAEENLAKLKKERSPNRIYMIMLSIAVLAGIVYAFFFGR